MAETKPIDAITHIYKAIGYLNPALRRVAEYILNNPEQCKTITIKELAAACKVAESTVTRFVKVIGLNNYQELKIGIAEALTLNESSNAANEENHVYEDILRTDTIEIIIDKVLYKNIQTLTETKQRLDADNLNSAVNVIENATIIILISTGSSSIAAEEAMMRFTRAGKKCMILRDGSIQLMACATLGPNDVVIGFSDSGRTKSVVQSMRIAQSKGAHTIGITSYDNSPLAKYSDIKLFTPTKTSPDMSALYWESTTSKSAQILMVDILYACFATKHFDETLLSLEETTKAVRDTREK